MQFFSDMISDMTNGDLLFSEANQDVQLCTFVTTLGDSIVEAATSFSLQLVLGIENERVKIEPLSLNVTVEDNDSMCLLHTVVHGDSPLER